MAALNLLVFAQYSLANYDWSELIFKHALNITRARIFHLYQPTPLRMSNH